MKAILKKISNLFSPKRIGYRDLADAIKDPDIRRRLAYELDLWYDTKEKGSRRKGVLEFVLPEDAVDFQTAIDGIKWKIVAWDLDQHLRSELKYSQLNESESRSLQIMRDKLRELMQEQNLTFE